MAEKTCVNCACNKVCNHDLYGFENCGNSISAADVVEVVRCKDCRYLMFSDCYGECKQNHLGIVRPDDYCSYGERKDGKENGNNGS